MMNMRKKLSNKRMKSKDFQTMARALREHDIHPVINYKKAIHIETLRFNQKEG